MRAHAVAMAVRALALCLLLFAGAAQASSYFLEQITSLANKGEIRRLRRAGIRTTDHLAYAGATPEARQGLSRSSGLSPQRLQVLVGMADLMRLPGIGPDAARVMHAAGCHSLTELKVSDPFALGEAIQRVNLRNRFTQNPPRADNLAVWIRNARRLPDFFVPDPSPPAATADPAAQR